jgi:hypothetical protein
MKALKLMLLALVLVAPTFSSIAGGVIPNEAGACGADGTRSRSEATTLSTIDSLPIHRVSRRDVHSSLARKGGEAGRCAEHQKTKPASA